ncbi:MAG: preprotein translocase subunit SecE [Candidatus Izemoplasmatales bacterium]|jgi:preprotein translocase SecE subunit
MAEKQNDTKAETKVSKTQKPQKDAQKQSRIMEILKKEYKFENWLLAILSPVLLLYGVYIVLGRFGYATPQLKDILGSSGFAFIDFFFNTTLKRVLTGSFLILIGVLVIVYLALPIMRPSFAELKKVSWPTGKTLAINTSRVFGFLIFLMLVFTLYGFILEPLFRLIISDQS